MPEDAEVEELEPGTAETPVSPSTPVTTDDGGDAAELTLEEAQEWSGHKLDDLSGSTVGRVEGVYVDAENGQPEWLLARMGRFGHYCLVPARDAVAAAGHVWVPFAREKVRKAPKQAPDQPLGREAEQELLDYYGVGTGEVGRGADLANRDAGAITSRPA